MRQFTKWKRTVSTAMTALLVLSSLPFSSGTAQAAAELPYSENFEGWAANTNYVNSYSGTSKSGTTTSSGVTVNNTKFTTTLLDGVVDTTSLTDLNAEVTSSNGSKALHIYDKVKDTKASINALTTFAAQPVSSSATQALVLNYDFMINPTVSGGSISSGRFRIANSANNARPISIETQNGNKLQYRNASNVLTDFSPALVFNNSAWYNAKITINLANSTYSVTVTDITDSQRPTYKAENVGFNGTSDNIGGLDINTGDGAQMEIFLDNLNIYNEALTPSLPAPIGVAASAGNAKVDLSWSTVTGATYYTVKRNTNGGAPYATIATNVKEAVYSDTQLTNGTKYYYVVTASSATLESGNSTEVSATPFAIAAPAGLKAAAGDAKVTLSWNAVTGATGYKVKRGTASGVYTDLKTLSDSTVTYTDEAVANGTAYYYVVTALSGTSEGASSNEASATPAELVLPSAPVNVTAMGGDRQVSVAWNSVAGAEAYNVMRSEALDGTYAVIASNVTDTSYTDTGLTNGTAYYYKVSAKNGIGESSHSVVVAGKPGAYLVNDNFETSTLGTFPTGYTPPYGSGVITAFSDTNNTSVINNNNLTNSYKQASAAVVGNSTNVLWINDGPGRGGFNKAFAPVTAASEKGITAQLRFMQPKTVGDSYVLELLDSGKKTALSLKFDFPTQKFKENIWYTVKYVADVKANTADMYIDYNDGKGLQYIGNYNFAAAVTDISSINFRMAGSSTASGYVDDVLVYQQEVTTPQSLAAVGANEKVELSWFEASGAASYKIYRKSASDSPYELIGTAESNSYTDTDKLKNESSYSYKVTAVGASGESDPSNEAVATPTAIMPPSAEIEGLQALVRDGQLTITWDPVVTTQNKEQIYYTLERGTKPEGPFEPLLLNGKSKISDTFYLDMGLRNGTEYYYNVTPGNQGGLGKPKQLQKVSPAAALGAPTLLDAKPGNGRVDLNWSTVTNATYYNVSRSTVNGGPYTVISEKGIAGTSFSDTAAENGKAFYYVVTAANDKQASMTSNQLRAKPYVPVSGAPGKPSGLTAVANDGSVSLSWDSAADATSYHVKRAEASIGEYKELAATSSRSYEDKSVVNGTTYYYAISAANSKGESQAADEIVVLPAKVLTVDKSAAANGTTIFNTIQSAVNSIPTSNTERTVIQIASGTYTEKLKVDRPYVSLVGAGMDATIIVYGDYAGTSTTTGKPGHTGNTFLSQTVDVTADYFTASNLTIENSSGPRSEVAQAVALSLKSDMAVLESVKLKGYQDTLYNGLNANKKGRHYVRNSVIQGDVDFIFGEAPAVVMDNVKMVLVSNSGGGGHITAGAQVNETDKGYVFLNSQIVDDASAQGTYDLGRPWKAYARVSFINTFINSNKFLPSGWVAACAGSCTKSYFSEYNSYGPGANASMRTIATQLTGAEASVTIPQLFDGWDPSIPVIMPGVQYLPTVSVTDSTFDKNPAKQADIYVTVNANGRVLTNVTNGKTVLDSTVIEATGTGYVIKKAYLAGLPDGAATLAFNFSDISVPLIINVVNSAAIDIGREVLAANDGWASYTTGVTGGSAANADNVFIVSKRSELVKAVSGTTPKIIYVNGTIDMNVDDNDQPVGMDFYKDPSYDFDAYLAAYDPAVWGTKNLPSGDLETARSKSATNQGNRIKITVGSNTTIVGLPGSNAKILGGNINLDKVDNIIIRNIEFQNTFDYFPQWDPTDGDAGNWNSAYDNISVKGSTHVWIDHNTFSDTGGLDDRSHTYYGRKYQQHDGTVDITNASDLATVSYNYFHDHDKTSLVGGSDSASTDAGKLRVTFHHNYYQNVGQRVPRVRFGQVHVYNNYYEGTFAHERYPYLYSIGVGYQSQVYAQNNYFTNDAGTLPSALIQVSPGGTTFTDTGSILNGSAVHIAATNSTLTPVSWTPKLHTSIDATADVPGLVMAQAGAEGTIVMPEKPAAPADVTAIAGNRTVALKWSAAAGADSYVVKRSTSSTGAYTLVAENLTATAYTDTSVANDTTYYYVVAGVNKAGEGTASKQVSATPSKSDSDRSSGGGSFSANTPPVQTNPTTPGQASTVTVAAPTPVKEKTADGRTVLKVSLDEASIQKAIDSVKAAADNQVLVVDIKGSEPAAQVQLPAAALAKAQSQLPSATLSVQYANTAYALPVKAIDLDSLVKSLGVDVKDVNVTIAIEHVDEAASAAIASAAERMGLKPLASAVDFAVRGEVKGKTIVIDDFGSIYVPRSITVEKPADVSKVVAVMYNASTGAFTYVPAYFEIVNGKLQATIKHPGNNVYMIAETVDKSFADLNGHWAKADIELLASKLIVNGASDTSYSPQSAVTRAEFASLLVRALGLTETKAASYTDTKGSEWYAAAVGAAAKAGIIDGFEDGTFRAQATITREQMSVMIARAMTLAGKAGAADAKSLASFSDNQTISGWAKDAVAQAASAGIVNGMADQTFQPKQQASRAEAAVMLKRLLQAIQFMN